MPAPDRKRRLTAFLVAMAVLIATPLVVVAADAFTDVPDSNVFHEDIAWLADAGVTKGCNPPDNTEFCPSDNVTREQMSAFMRRLAQYMDAEDGTPAQADHATTADSATSAGDADTLDGKNGTAYQTAAAYSAHSFLTDPLGNLVSGPHELTSVSITVPAAGVIFLQGLGTWEDAGVDTNVVQWFENDTATSCDSFADGDAIAGSVSENALKGASDFDSATISSIGVIEVGTAGTTTVYACAIVQGGSANNYERALAAQWYPTGTVSLARAGSVPDFSPAEQGLGSD